MSFMGPGGMELAECLSNTPEALGSKPNTHNTESKGQLTHIYVIYKRLLYYKYYL